ncbi:MAG: cation:proton antiporter [Oscillospiraceae bacterium]|nr:cation:proton antiporter [Oscillospiraceae bacterium]
MNLLLMLALVLILTKTFGLFTRRIHLPQVVGALLAGVVLGPALLNIVRPNELIGALADIGVILLMFSAGLETDLQQLRCSLRQSLTIAVLGAILPLAGGFALASLFGLGFYESIFIGVILTATSVSITAETLTEMGKLSTKAGTVILGAAVIDDILGVVILLLAITFGGGGGVGAESGGMEMAAVGLTLLKICLFFVLAIVCGVYMSKFFGFLSNKFGNRRRLCIFGLAFCFFFAYIAEYFGVSDIIGAYFAGLALCSNKSEHYIHDKVSTLSFMFFSPIFFVSVGLMMTFDGLTASTVIFTALLLIVAIATKLFGCGLGGRICGYSKRLCFQIGAGMVSRGEVAIVIAVKGIAIGLMDSGLFSGVIIVVIVTTLLTPILLKVAFRRDEINAVQSQ